MTEPLLQVKDLKVHFPVTEGVLFSRQVGSVKAVDGVSFDIQRGETLSLVGESGCGKSTTALAILRMLPVTEGQILFDGEDITQRFGNQLGATRPRIQMVYQDPFGSLNPRMKVQDIIGEPLKVHRPNQTKPDYTKRIKELMDIVGLLPNMADRYPHEFSGGQRQRIGIARALALQPDLLICDEAVSALDVSIQAQVINLLMQLQKDFGLTYLFISHDLSVVRHVSDRIAVMYLGQFVEVKARDTLFSNAQHPYTKTLLDAVPIANPDIEAQRPQPLIVGEVPSVRNPPHGCRFHPRCQHVIDQCATTAPLPYQSDGGAVSCHLLANRATTESAAP
ncbi:MAG: oligopeptide/dipeptide ABC transporter ATP-binding protein [Pseudomonadota bacterium]